MTVDAVDAVDIDAAVQFLRTAFEPDDWVALLVKAKNDPRVRQRVVPLSLATSSTILDWLTQENVSAGMSVYVTVNAVQPRQTSRSRSAMGAVRHVFLDVDRGGDEVLRRLGSRRDLPPISYVLRSSRDRFHLFWRVEGFRHLEVERLHKSLARELGTDPAATACSQLTRLAGFANRKYDDAPLVTVEYLNPAPRFGPADFPTPQATSVVMGTTDPRGQFSAHRALDRARSYIAKVAPAVSGRHGDVKTFQVCCRLVRGFGLSDSDAMDVLAGWNTRCRPPWTERELEDKLRRARLYGREPIGGLLHRGRGSESSAEV